MTDETEIREILITRDIRAFVARDWSATAGDFASDFTAYSAASGEVRLAYPHLDVYRHDWEKQAEAFANVDRDALAAQLHSAQQLVHIEVTDDRALATKVFDGVIDGPDGVAHLEWTSHYFLRRDASKWLITGFMGYIRSGGTR